MAGPTESVRPFSSAGVQICNFERSGEGDEEVVIEGLGQPAKRFRAEEEVDGVRG